MPIEDALPYNPDIPTRLPVHVPSDPKGVLDAGHGVRDLLANDTLVIVRYVLSITLMISVRCWSLGLTEQTAGDAECVYGGEFRKLNGADGSTSKLIDMQSILRRVIWSVCEPSPIIQSRR